MRWPRLFRSADAVPPGAARPSATFWLRGGGLPPVAWAPRSGEFSTLWDWDLADAMGIPGLWRARMLISQAVGAMPLAAWRGLDALEPVPVILSEPCPGEDRCNTVAAWVLDLLDHGNAVGVYTSWSAEGKPTSVQPVRCSDAEIGADPQTGAVYYRIGQAAYGRGEVFHAKMSSLPGDLRGMGVLEVGLSPIGRMRSEAEYGANAFSSGVPSGLLRVRDPDLQEGSPDDPPGFATAHGLKAAWKASAMTGDVAVMSELVDFTPLSWTPSDAQMVEARQLSLVDTANLFNLDPYWVGASQVSAPYQNVHEAALQLSRFTLGFPMGALEAEFSRALPRGTDARFNRDTILREDLATRVETYAKMLDAGIVTVAEVRAFEGLPPLPEQPQPQLPTVVPLTSHGDPGANTSMTG